MEEKVQGNFFETKTTFIQKYINSQKSYGFVTWRFVFKTIFRLSFELRNPVVKVKYSFYLVVPCAYKTLAAEKQYDSFPYKLRLLCAFRTMHVLGYPFLKLYSKD